MRPFGLLILAACTGHPATDGTTRDTDVPAIACGAALTCTGGKVCVEESEPPVCEARQDTDAPCPEGTTESLCGGAGYACCCGPTPPMTYQCYAPTGCGDTVRCDCVAAACSEGKWCTGVSSETSGIFLCEDPPVP